jgi:hypothetical protein
MTDGLGWALFLYVFLPGLAVGIGIVLLIRWLT